MNYKEALEFISRVPWLTCEPGLDRITKLLFAIGNPQDELKFIHVAGTNGKGSTAAMLAAIFTECGYRTGLFTSPHIFRFNERIQVDGSMILDDEVAEVTSYVGEKAKGVAEDATEFEVITAVGFEYFRRKQCDIVILEVGLGGTLDCTNVIDPPEAAIITAIGLDHVSVLGDTLTQIAEAKAGIIKPGSPVIVYGGEHEVETVLKQTAAKQQTSLYQTDFSKLVAHSRNLDEQCFDFGEYENVSIPLIGTYQLFNAALVLTAVDVLREKGWELSKQNVKLGLKKTNWPSRFEIIGKEPIFIVDGAHNPHGISATAESLYKYFPDRKIVFILGILVDKDADDMLNVIMPLALEVITLTPDSPRAISAEDLADKIKARGIPAVPYTFAGEGVREAVRKAGKDGVVCALGSLYLAGEIREYIKNNG